MDRCLGFGGLGDCFIVILKLLEYNEPVIYTHIDTSFDRLELSKQLLDYFNIQHECYVVDDIRKWWTFNSPTFDKHFNVFANGYINIPKRPYHWEPCVDSGYTYPFTTSPLEKNGCVAVQVNSGGDRTYKKKPIVEYVLDNYEHDKIRWFGTDVDFNSKYGTNFCGKLNFIEALKEIRKCTYFVGFPSVLLYWSLWNKSSSYIFTDHQGKDDLRIHNKWKKNMMYDIGEV